MITAPAALECVSHMRVRTCRAHSIAKLCVWNLQTMYVCAHMSADTHTRELAGRRPYVRRTDADDCLPLAALCVGPPVQY